MPTAWSTTVTMRDYYAVLGVEAGATAIQIRRAYQRLARRYSPDVNFWDHSARAVFEEIWRVLHPGGWLQFADIANGRPVPPEALRDIDLWTG